MHFVQYAQDTTIALASQCWYAGSVESSQVDYVFNAFFKYNIYMKTSFLYRNVIRLFDEIMKFSSLNITISGIF